MKESALEQIAGRLRRKAYDASRRLGLDPMEAEDVAQDVMLKLWAMRDELDNYSSVEALASVMGRRLSLNKLRGGKTVSMEDGRCRSVTVTGGPQEVLEEKEDAEWLAHRIEELPATQHTILYMRQVERRSNREIAALLGIEETSVSTLLARARRTLLGEIRLRNK